MITSMSEVEVERLRELVATHRSKYGVFEFVWKKDFLTYAGGVGQAALPGRAHVLSVANNTSLSSKYKYCWAVQAEVEKLRELVAHTQ